MLSKIYAAKKFGIVSIREKSLEPVACLCKYLCLTITLLVRNGLFVVLLEVCINTLDVFTFAHSKRIDEMTPDREFNFSIIHRHKGIYKIDPQ